MSCTVKDLKEFLETVPETLVFGVRDFNFGELCEHLNLEDFEIKGNFLLVRGTAQQYID